MTPPRLLIVDDEPPIRRFLHTILAAQGYRVEEAADGEGALEFLKHNMVDLIILDLGRRAWTGWGCAPAAGGQRPDPDPSFFPAAMMRGQCGGARPGRRRLHRQVLWRRRTFRPPARCRLTAPPRLGD